MGPGERKLRYATPKKKDSRRMATGLAPRRVTEVSWCVMQCDACQCDAEINRCVHSSGVRLAVSSHGYGHAKQNCSIGDRIVGSIDRLVGWLVYFLACESFEVIVADFICAFICLTKYCLYDRMSPFHGLTSL